ncbi:MAG: YggS family pyridoxal phosphate-dependent enzyme [Gammaproteobacteria bacterium]|nr:MAG: YggS family pyridoxal phosphate-dependent enzyme [Gammaproteobacteria bacterium]
MNPSRIAERLAQVKQRIAAAARSCDRDPNAVRLIAVSKTRPVSDILEAHAAGQHAFGENYLQDALPKIEALQEYPLEWHFIGRIQSNKTRDIASHFHWVHTLSSAKHARRLSDQRPVELAPLQVCIQVNISGEASKSGTTPEAAGALAEVIAGLPRLALRGLMTMPPADSTEAQQRQIFSALRHLLEDLNRTGLSMDSLSMGMSNDMQAAICEGATMVRIGTAIFGPRQ